MEFVYHLFDVLLVFEESSTRCAHVTAENTVERPARLKPVGVEQLYDFS